MDIFDKILQMNKSYVFYGDNLPILEILSKHYKNKVDLIYIDPPFATNNIFTMSDNKANSISSSKKDDIAYIDKYTLNDYLEFLKPRFVLLKELLSDIGSIYIHIDYKIGHYVKILLDEIFGINCFINDITRIKSNPKNFSRRAYGNIKDMILFYAKNPKKNIWNDITIPINNEQINKLYKKIDIDGRLYTTVPCHAPGETINGVTGSYWKGILPPKGRHWRQSPELLDELDRQGLIEWSTTGNPRIKKYADEHKGSKIQDIWYDYKDTHKPKYPTEKNYNMLEMIIKQSSNETSLVLDAFAGSGTFLQAAFNNKRYFIGIDSSLSSMKVIKNRNLGEYYYFEY